MSFRDAAFDHLIPFHSIFWRGGWNRPRNEGAKRPLLRGRARSDFGKGFAPDLGRVGGDANPARQP